MEESAPSSESPAHNDLPPSAKPSRTDRAREEGRCAKWEQGAANYIYVH
jgi:hypothetical protein